MGQEYDLVVFTLTEEYSKCVTKFKYKITEKFPGQLLFECRIQYLSFEAVVPTWTEYF